MQVENRPSLKLSGAVLVSGLENLSALRYDRSMKQTWKPVPFAPGYDVSDCGNVRSWRPRNGIGALSKVSRPVKLVPGDNGYWRVTVTVDGKRKMMEVHRIMAITFLGDQSDRFRLVRHLDDNKKNNVIGNLAWGGAVENAADAARNGLILRGESHGMAELTEEKVREIFRLSGLGWGARRIAKEIQTSRSNVRFILAGKTWAHLGLAGSNG